MMAGSMGNYPWLADSWPTTTTNLVHNSKEAVDCCPAKHDATDRYYNGRTGGRAAGGRGRLGGHL
jgi:roundabout axon guidance receptor 3